MQKTRGGKHSASRHSASRRRGHTKRHRRRTRTPKATRFGKLEKRVAGLANDTVKLVPFVGRPIDRFSRGLLRDVRVTTGRRN